jgi:hypothetical protein
MLQLVTITPRPKYLVFGESDKFFFASSILLALDKTSTLTIDQHLKLEG